jgi:hypothetical protein
MKKVTIRGTGQLNGPKDVFKVLELEDQAAQNLTGQNRDKVIIALLAVHFPGVKIDPRKIGINVESIYVKTDHNNSSQPTKKRKSSPLTFSSIILWILFFPFKLVWWLFKAIWNDKALSKKDY